MRTRDDGAARSVAYDAQAFLAPNGGTGKGLQLRNLLGPHLTRFTGFASRGHNHSNLPLVQKGLSRYHLWQQISLPILLWQAKSQIFLAPYNTAPLLIPSSTDLILVLHDVILLERFSGADFHRKLVDAYRRFLVPRAVARARLVLTVSQYSRQQILSHFPQAKVEVIPCTIPEWWFSGQSATPSERETKYLLMVTSSAPHKNAAKALEAYSRYAANAGTSAVSLRVVGLSNEAASYRPMLKALDLEDLVTIEPYVSDQELRGLYLGAEAVLVPSLVEGFGIPVLEGMAVGTPVISSNTTSLPEVGGDAPYYFDPTSLAEMTNAIKKVLADVELRKKMSKAGAAQAQKFHPRIIQRKVEEFWMSMANIRAEVTSPC